MICAFEVVTLLNPFLHLNCQQDAKNYWSKYFLFSQFHDIDFFDSGLSKYDWIHEIGKKLSCGI